MGEQHRIVIRDGPSGRRATLVGGPDVWEVVVAVKAARSAEPDLPDSDLLKMLEANTGVSASMARAALTYWHGHPDEVQPFVEQAEQAARLYDV